MAATIDLSKYGIHDVKEVVYNPGYQMLFEEETRPDLEGYEKGVVTGSGAVAVRTGIFTGRSPKDKFIVYDDVSKENLWWNSERAPNDNKPITPEAWSDLKEVVVEELSNKRSQENLALPISEKKLNWLIEDLENQLRYLCV